MPESKQWVITCVIEGPYHPFDYVAEFLESVRFRGDYAIVSSVTTEASGIASNGIAPSPNDDHDNSGTSAPCFCGDSHDYRSFAEICCSPGERLDGHDYATTYTGRYRGH